MLGNDSYAVSVVASDDRAARARITVTINVTNRRASVQPARQPLGACPRALPAGTDAGGPVTATDADPDDTLTYSLAGTDAASFTIDSSNGQLSTRASGSGAGSGLRTRSRLSQPTSTAPLARITVTINITNRAPAFTGTSASRSLDRNAGAGTSIGDPVSATDPDPDDTLTYSLTGTDAASFTIEGATGQLRTRAGVAIDQGLVHGSRDRYRRGWRHRQDYGDDQP